MARPKTSWEVKLGEVPSPLAGVPKDAKIVVTEKARAAAEKRLKKKLKPYETKPGRCKIRA